MSTARPKCDQPSKGETRRHKSGSQERQREAARRIESPSHYERRKHDQAGEDETRRRKSRSRERQGEASRRIQSPSHYERRKHEQGGKDDTRRHKSRSRERQREGSRRIQSPSNHESETPSRRKHDQPGKGDAHRHKSSSHEGCGKGSRMIRSPSHYERGRPRHNGRSNSLERGRPEHSGRSSSLARRRPEHSRRSSSLASGMRSTGKLHWSHPKHPLERVHLESMYTCNGCEMDGMGPRHRCKSCNFDLHEECMSAPLSKTFQGYNCRFLKKPFFPSTFCDACGLQAKGFVFHCAQSRMDFHPMCAKLRSEIRCYDITFKLQQQAPSNCQWCNKKRVKGTDKEVPGWAYASSSGIGFHVYCVLEMAMQMRTCTANSRGDLTVALRAMSLKPESDRRGGGSDSKWPEKIGVTVLKILASTLLGHLGGVVHLVDAFLS